MILNKKTVLSFFVLCFLSTSVFAADLSRFEKRANNATDTLVDIMAAPDQTVPTSLLNNAACVAVIPGAIKAALTVAGTYGRGLVSCRTGAGWSVPLFVSLAGGSIGWQAGVKSTDIVLVFMNTNAIDKLAEGEFNLGGSASVAAGPLGRTATAGVDYKLDHEVYSYSHSQGLFAGLSIEGNLIKPDTSANRQVYGNVMPINLLTQAYFAQVSSSVTSSFALTLERMAPHH